MLCLYLLFCAFICNFFAFICHFVLSFVISCVHLSSSDFICNFCLLLSFCAFVCHLVPSLVILCPHFAFYAFICKFLPSFAILWLCLSFCSFLCYFVLPCGNRLLLTEHLEPERWGLASSWTTWSLRLVNFLMFTNPILYMQCDKNPFPTHNIIFFLW